MLKGFPWLVCSSIDRDVGSVEGGVIVPGHCRAQVGAVGYHSRHYHTYVVHTAFERLRLSRPHSSPTLD